MARSFFSHLFFIVLLNLIVKPFYILGIEVSVQNSVGTTSYGLFFALLNSAYLFQIVNDFGLQVYNNRNVASSQLHTAKFSELIALKAGLAALFVLAVMTFGYFAGYQASWQLLFIICINLILTSFLLLVRSSISGLGLYRMDSLLSVLDKGLMILVCGGMLLFLGDFTIYHFALAQTGTLLIAVTAALGILMRRTPIFIRVPSIARIKGLLRDAGPYALAVFLMSLYTRVDGVMIEQLHVQGAYEAGLYAAGYRLLDAATMFAFLFAVLLLPMFTRLLKNDRELKALLSQAARLMIVFTITASATCVMFRHEIMTLLYPESTANWGNAFGLLMASLNGIGMMYIFGTYLTALGAMRTLNLSYGVFVILNIVLNLVLIPLQGAYGAAAATLITQTIVGLVLYVHTSRVLSWVPSRRELTRNLLFLFVTAAIICVYIFVNVEVTWFIRALILVGLLLGGALATNMISRIELREIVQSKNQEP